MTANPCKGLTKAQTSVFLMIAIDFFPSCSNATLQTLLDRGLILRRKTLTSSKYDYFVPRPLFARWVKSTNERFKE